MSNMGRRSREIRFGNNNICDAYWVQLASAPFFTRPSLVEEVPHRLQREKDEIQIRKRLIERLVVSGVLIGIMVLRNRIDFESALPKGEYDESEYYGPYNGLLNDLFPKEEHYMKHLVFFIEIKPAGYIYNVSPCTSADKQMWESFKDLGDRVEIPILYSVSAIRSKLCFYKYTEVTGDLEPELIPSSARKVIDIAPITRWGVDILTPQGE
ncbi:hypothetical protein RUND412_009677 [Rhizina undulata]